MSFDWKAVDLSEFAKSYLELAEALGLDVVGEDTADLHAAACSGNKGKIVARLMDITRPLAVLDRILIASVLEGTISAPSHRPVHPYLPRALLGLDTILRIEQGYEKEAARVARIQALTKLSPNTIRKHIRNVEAQYRRICEEIQDSRNDKQLSWLKKTVLHELKQAGIRIQGF